MSSRVLLYVIMYTLVTCTPRPPSTTTTLRLTAQRNDTGTWTAKFGDYQMIIEHKHFNKDPLKEDQDGTWTLKVRHTSTVYEDEDVNKQMVMDILQHYNNTSTTMQPSNNQYATMSSNNEYGQVDQMSSNNQYGYVDQLPTNNEYERMDYLTKSNEYGQVDQLSSNNETRNEESAEEQLTNEEREQFLAEEERQLIMDRYPRSRSLGSDVREFDLESRGYRYYPEVGWVKLNTAHWQWDQARKSCEADGGHLVIPDTLQKIKAFTRILKNNVDIIERAVLKNQVFVGVYVPYNNRRFITVKGETFIPESVSIWFPNEPNDADPGEDCVTLHLEGKLRDVPCYFNLPFLCQIL